MSYFDPDLDNDKYVFYNNLWLVAKIAFWVCLIIWIISLLTSCAGIEEQNRAYTAQENVVKAQATRTQPKSLVVDCTGGCGAAIVTFIHHKDMQVMQVPRVTGTNDVIIGTLPSVITGVGYVAGAIAATQIFDDISKNMGGGNTTNTSTNNVTGNDNTNNQDKNVTTSSSQADGNKTSNVTDNMVQSNNPTDTDSSTNNPDSSNSSTTDNANNSTTNNSDNSTVDNSDSSTTTTNPVTEE